MRLSLTQSILSCGVVMALLTGLSACGPVTLSHMTLRPVAIDNYFVRNGYDWNIYCGLSLVGQAPVPFAEPGEMGVGLDNYFDPGSGLFPCQEKHDLAYFGVVRFDVAGLKNVVTAKLNFTWKWTSMTGPGTTANSAARRLWLVKGDPWSVVEPLLDLYPDDKVFSIEVTSVVRDWISGATPNLGLSITGDTNFAESNDVWISRYADFQLDILYNPN